MTTSTVQAVAQWPVPQLRGGIGQLAAVLHVVDGWRARAEQVGHELTAPDCWSGQAATDAAAALVRLSDVTTAATNAFRSSLDDAQVMVAAAQRALDLAEEALAVAAAVPVELDGNGVPGALPEVPLPAGDPAAARVAQLDAMAHDADVALRAHHLAQAALREAGRAERAAADALGALAPLGITPGSAPATWGELTELVENIAVPLTVPALDASPEEVSAWWSGLSEGQREEWIAGAPDRIGALDGVPAWARDEANRRLLDRALADPRAPGHEVALATAAALAAQEAKGDQVQLYTFVPEDGYVAVTLGDLDTADDIALVVPGTGNDAADDLDDVLGNAETVRDAAVAAGAGTVATMAVLSFTLPPGLTDARNRNYAERAAGSLDRTLDGIAATRAATQEIAGDPEVTVIAHSYGTVVVDEAIDEVGDLAADDVILVGSPGMQQMADEFEGATVYQALADDDPIRYVPNSPVPHVPSPVSVSTDIVDAAFGTDIDFGDFGVQTDDSVFGSCSLPTEPDAGHSDYFDEGSVTVEAMGQVIAHHH